MARLNFIYLFIVIILFSCSSKDTVEIVNFLPKGEVEKTTNFTVEFSKDLAPVDKIGEWLNDEFIQFVPKLEGKFKWIDLRTLQFSPDYSLESMQNYSATITNKVLFNKNISTDFEEFKFYTPKFDVTKAEYFWSQIPHKSYTTTIQANLYFSYATKPDEVAKKISVSIDGKPLNNYEIVSTESSDIIAINLGEIKQSDEDQDIEIKIAKGLKSIFDKEGLKEDRTFEYTLSKISKLDITSVSSGFDGKDGWIDIYTNQTLLKENIERYITFEPKQILEFKVFDNHIRVTSKMNKVKTLTLKVKKGLPGLYGGILDREYERVISLVNIDPSINFADSKGKYLMLPGSKNLTVNVVNVEEVDVEVSQIHKNNIIYFKDRFRNNRFDYYYDYGYSYSPHYSPDSYGKALYKDKVKLETTENWLNTVNVNLEKALDPEFKGIFLVEVRSNEKRWVKDSKILAISDLGIIVKKANNELIVFINSLSGAEPIQNAKVEVFSTHNTSMYSDLTNSQGAVKFPLKNGKYEDDSPKMIYVEYENDFNYLYLRESRIETSRFDVGGISNYSDNYKAYMYAERNLYRPGEDVNLSGIIRNDEMNIITDEPVVLKIITPQGKVLEEYAKTLNEQGSYEQSFTMPSYAQTGLYRAELYNGTKNLIGSYNFSVEDFVPDKIRVNLKVENEMYSPDETMKADLDAEFLFGAKAAKLKYEGEIQFKQSGFRSKSFKDFSFRNYVGEKTNLSNHTFEGILDDNGSAKIEYIIPKKLESGGKITSFIYSSVFDLTGRTVNRVAQFDIFTKDDFIGIKRPDYYLSKNNNHDFGIVSVDKNDHPSKPYQAIAKLVRYEWQSVLRKDNSGRTRYTSVKVEKVEWEREIEISGKSSVISLSANHRGQYELRVAKKGSSGYQKSNFYMYGWSGGDDSNFEIDKEGRIDIVLDKDLYEPGEKATVLFKCPFSGKLLLTLERNGVYEYKYIDVKNNSAQTTFDITNDYMPNIFISATLFKEHGGKSEAPFLVGHGFASLKVEKKANKLPVNIISANKIKPNTTQEIVIKTTPYKNIYVTFAAVDEGILQIKNFETPDAYKMMYAKRPLKVNSYDLYSLLLPEVSDDNSSTGGDDLAKQLKKRVNPVTSKRYKLLSYWSGIKKTNSKGEVKISLPIPQFNGELRLMALVYDGPRFGSGEKSIKVSDDLIIEAEMPRFLSINDKLTSNVTLINTTDKKSEVVITATVSGVIKLVSEEYKTVEIEPNSTANVEFNFLADDNVGEAKITFETEGSAKVKEVINIGVRPISPLVVESGFGEIKAGEEVKINLPDHFINGSQNTELTISALPIIKFAKHLRYILGYPHGCLEQTLSRVFPQLYFGEISKKIYPKLYKNNNSIYFVNEGIKKIESMVLHDGSIAYWRGGRKANWWSTVFASHFLVEAKKAGFYVDEKVLNKVLSYLSSRVKEKKTYDYTSYTNNKKTIKKIAKKEILYSLYVLALSGKGDISTMNYYKSMPHLLSRDSQYFLAGAYALMENRTGYNEIIPEEFLSETTERLSGGSFDSSIRANAIMLNVLVEVDPTNLQIPLIVKYLSQHSDKMYSTQDKSFSFLALGKALKAQSNSDLKVDIVIDGEITNSYKNKPLTISDIETKDNSILLKANGKGKVYYFWNSEGISKSKKVKEIDSQMKIRRTYYDYKSKQEIVNSQFKQGDLIVCKISLTGGTRSAENIAISDLIPAGFEIENPRLSTSTNFDWKVKDRMILDHMDIRDDRLILFTRSVSKRNYEFYYMLRVVNKGEFQLPVIGAEAMYDKEYHSFNGAGVITVK
jgi:alpha-2-macroglobulin